MIHKKYAIVGSGPAAFYAAGAIRRHDPVGEIVMIGAEGCLPYFRPLISYYLAGRVPLERLFLKETDYYRQKKLEFISGTVTVVNGRERTLSYRLLAEGKTETTASLQFEKLLIASGGAPALPEIPGIRTPGVYALRTIKDAAAIAERAKDAEKAVLIGGGLVSLKAAYALRKLGLETTLVVASSGVLSRVLDKNGAAIVAAHLVENGLEMILQRDVAAIHGSNRGVTAVTLTDGQELEADLVVVGKGVKPFTPFLKNSGIKETDGVVADAQLQTNIPGIYAAGDAAICRDLLLGAPANNALWPNAAAQGEIAGANMSGTQLVYRGSMRMNATEFFGLPVIAAGLGRVQSSAEQPWEIYEIQRPLRSGTEPRYLRLVFQKECLVGYVAVGENRKAGLLTNLIMGRTPLAPRLKERLKNGDLLFPFAV